MSYPAYVPSDGSIVEHRLTGRHRHRITWLRRRYVLQVEVEVVRVGSIFDSPMLDRTPAYDPPRVYWRDAKPEDYQ